MPNFHILVKKRATGEQHDLYFTTASRDAALWEAAYFCGAYHHEPFDLVAITQQGS